MNQAKGLVSIVIPAYNAENFIAGAINSILSETYRSWEIIVINDGSFDKTEEIARSFPDSRISVVSQMNSGVSAARNRGLELSKGEFIIFFDADDVMTQDFLQVRIDVLNQNYQIGFVGGLVETFPKKTIVRRAVAENPEKEIHFFDAGVVTIPSNYLFRRAVIKDHNITFNPVLNSSADRFFLLEIAKYTKGRSLVGEKGKLLYRISESSMSHHVTPKLILDYYKFYKELNARDLLPAKKRREIKSRYLFSIASSFSLIRYWGSCFKLLFRSFMMHPVLFFKLATKKGFKNSN